MVDEVLTPEERALFSRAEAEALTGLSFDFEAGLADVKRRAPAGIPRQRTGSSVRARISVVAAVVMTAFGVTYGFQQATTGALVFSGPLPPSRSSPQASALSTPPPSSPSGPSSIASAAVYPGGPTARPASPPVGPPSLTGPVGSPFAGGPLGLPSTGGSAGSPSVGGPEGSPSAGGSAGSPSVGGPGGSPTAGGPAGSPSGAGPSRPAPTSPAPSGSPFPSTAGTATYRLRYPATLVTVPISGAAPQSLALDEPKIVNDGPVRISASPGTGDSVLASSGGVLAAMIPTADATPGDCAQAIQQTPDSQLPLREDRTYCLMTADSDPQQTLVRLNVEQPHQEGQLLLRIKAWDATP